MLAKRSNASSLSRFHAALIAPLVAGSFAAPVVAQSIAVLVVGDALHVTAPGFGFINADSLVRLKDGRSVRVDLELAVLAKQRTTATAQSRQTFVLSYDLWEERFAVTHAATQPQSVSHLTLSAAQAWCVERVSVPLAALGRLGREEPFWIRLGSRIQGIEARPDPDEGGVFTLRGLIDALSRRSPSSDVVHTIEAGPFRLRKGVGADFQASANTTQLVGN
jgi:hypothetical protein